MKVRVGSDKREGMRDRGSMDGWVGCQVDGENRNMPGSTEIREGGKGRTRSREEHPEKSYEVSGKGLRDGNVVHCAAGQNACCAGV